MVDTQGRDDHHLFRAHTAAFQFAQHGRKKLVDRSRATFIVDHQGNLHPRASQLHQGWQTEGR
jgi:hypothetical protein